jgi:hypothetical protein
MRVLDRKNYLLLIYNVNLFYGAILHGPSACAERERPDDTLGTFQRGL